MDSLICGLTDREISNWWSQIGRIFQILPSGIVFSFKVYLLKSLNHISWKT